MFWWAPARVNRNSLSTLRGNTRGSILLQSLTHHSSQLQTRPGHLRGCSKTSRLDIGNDGHFYDLDGCSRSVKIVCPTFCLNIRRPYQFWRPVDVRNCQLLTKQTKPSVQTTLRNSCSRLDLSRLNFSKQEDSKVYIFDKSTNAWMISQLKAV